MILVNTNQMDYSALGFFLEILVPKETSYAPTNPMQTQGKLTKAFLHLALHSEIAVIIHLRPSSELAVHYLGVSRLTCFAN